MHTRLKDNTKDLVFLEKKQLLIYSLYLCLGSLAFFIGLTGMYTTLQAVLWQYTIKYVVNSAVLSFVALTASMLLIGACYLLLKKHPMAQNAGFLGCSLFLIYPAFIFLFEPLMPYSYTYFILLSLPALVILIITGLLVKKNRTGPI